MCAQRSIAALTANPSHHLALSRVKGERDAHRLHHLDLLGRHVGREVDPAALLGLRLGFLPLASRAAVTGGVVLFLVLVPPLAVLVAVLVPR